MKTSRSRALSLIASCALLCQCTGRIKPIAATTVQATISPVQLDSPDLVVRLADIDAVEVSSPQGQPTMATLRIKGLLHDGATQIHKIDQQKFADGVSVTVTTARPKNSIARVALIPFERTVSVDVTGLPKGDCFVTVNTYRAVIHIP